MKALDASVSEIITNREKVLCALIELCSVMAREDRVSCICLGCIAMFSVYGELLSRLKERQIQVSVIEPTVNGMLTLQNLVRMGVSTHVPGRVDFSELHWIQR